MKRWACAAHCSAPTTTQPTWEDLEDIYAQSVLEVLLRVRRDPTVRTPAHIANTLRLRFRSRLADHCRAIGGRSPATTMLVGAERLDGPERPTVAGCTDVEGEVLSRARMREVLVALSGLPATQRDAILTDAGAITYHTQVAADTHRKRCWRGRRALRLQLSPDAGGVP